MNDCLTNVFAFVCGPNRGDDAQRGGVVLHVPRRVPDVVVLVTEWNGRRSTGQSQRILGRQSQPQQQASASSSLFFSPGRHQGRRCPPRFPPPAAFRSPPASRQRPSGSGRRRRYRTGRGLGRRGGGGGRGRLLPRERSLPSPDQVRRTKETRLNYQN